MAIGFISWFAGMVILVVNVLGCITEALYYDDFGKKIEEVFDGDYQNTEHFRYIISDYLNTFLDMSIAETNTDVVADIMDSVEVYEDYYEEIYEDYYWSETYDFSEWIMSKNDAEEYHKRIQNNRNILYTIANNDEILYTNEESLGLYDENFDMSELMKKGYNFLLYFDGKKVTVIKDGRLVNIYGDGYYQEGKDWYVPGYKNFPSDESISGSRICIAAIEVPNIIVKRNYGGGGRSYYNNRFYDIQQNLQYEKINYLWWINTSIVSVILLFIGFVLRRYRKEAIHAIGIITGKLWYEIKLVPVLGVAYVFIYCMIMSFNSLRWRGFDFIWEIRDYFGGYEYGISSLLMLIFIGGICIIWLFINDVRYNNKPWKNSLTARVVNLFTTSMLKLPFSKRMVRYNIWVFLSGLMVLFIPILVLIADSSFGTAFLIIPRVLLFAVIFFQLMYAKGMKQMAEDMDNLVNQIDAIHEGVLTETPKMSKNSGLERAMENLNDIRNGMNKAIDQQMRSERMKVELIANVSHDIKTPLTSIISYVELLKQEENLPDHVKEYISILENKSQRLKTMVQDVFEVSKAASGELPIHMENLDLGKLLRQTIADMQEQIENSAVNVKSEIPESAVMIHADGDRLYRVFQNLIQNALKYSLDGSRVYITLKNDGKLAIASVKNTSKEEIASDVDFTERFIRGDKSRSDGGSGLGLSIAQSFTEACGGTFKVETIADLFVVTVSFAEVIQS